MKQTSKRGTKVLNSRANTLAAMAAENQDIVNLICDPNMFSPEELEAIADCIEIRQYKKGALLIREGEIVDTCFYVIKGCVREFYLYDGEEKTTAFYMEEDTVSSIVNADKKHVSKSYIECLEDCTLTATTLERELWLYRKFPRFERLCRESMEEKLVQHQEKMAEYIMHSPEERYLKLLEEKPELVQRVPQYQLASYLGVKPESLSRIRKRIAMRA